MLVEFATSFARATVCISRVRFRARQVSLREVDHPSKDGPAPLNEIDVERRTEGLSVSDTVLVNVITRDGVRPWLRYFQTLHVIPKVNDRRDRDFPTTIAITASCTPTTVNFPV